MASKVKEKALARKEERKLASPSASMSGLRMSARRARVVADKIRGQKLSWVLDYLRMERRGAAEPIRNVVDSAMANADSKGMNIDDLRISEIKIDKGPIRKKFMPRAQGRATKIRKQTAHIHVELSDK